MNLTLYVTKSELELDSFNKRQRYSDAADYAFIIKDGIVMDGGVVKEYQCNEKDKFIDENGKEINIWEE